MEISIEIYVALATVIGSIVVSVLGYWFQKWLARRNEVNDLLARAQASVLKRVELCYRIARRTGGKRDDILLRDRIHDVQEENEYFRSLLFMKSRWLGARFDLYLKAVQEITKEPMRCAWRMEGNLSGDIDERIKIDEEILHKWNEQFAKDARRFNNPLLRTWMRIHDWNRKVRVYENGKV